jgi:hypothetical protein
MNDVMLELVEMCMCEKYFDYTKGMWVERHVEIEGLMETVVRECANMTINQYDKIRILKHFGLEE